MRWTMDRKFVGTPKMASITDDSDTDDYQPNGEVSSDFSRRRNLNSSITSSSRPAKVVTRHHQFTIAHPDPASGFGMVSNKAMAHPKQFQSIDQISGNVQIPKKLSSGTSSIILNKLSNDSSCTNDSISGSSEDGSDDPMDQSIDFDQNTRASDLQSPVSDRSRIDTPRNRVSRGVDLDRMTPEEREKYLEKRTRNNIAVRKSRDKAKAEKKEQDKKNKILQTKYDKTLERLKELERALEWEKRKNDLLNQTLETMKNALEKKAQS